VNADKTPEMFQLVVRVGEADIDALGHVNNVVYLKWVQDVAAAHWRALAPEEEQSGLVWVVTRHEIDYKSAAVLGDEVAVRTWVGVAEGLRFDRHTEVLRKSDGKLLARARTVWCPIDATTGRPRRVSPTVRELFSAASPSAGNGPDQ
jgi:acyl-CoA thioester hydrolase